MPSATTSSTSHRTKRAFLSSNQTSLDTFFRNATPSSTAPSPDRDARSPPLPSTIQSNLLTVGMRVRKSVPEGYKTHKMGFHEVHSSDIRLPETSSEPTSSRPAELQPFCGLLKVGGYGAQNTRSEYTTNAFEVQPFDPYQIPFSSQESNVSTNSNISTESMPARDPILKPLSSNPNASTTQRKRHISDEDEAPELLLPMASPAISQRTFAAPKRRRSPRLAQRQTLLDAHLAPPPEAVPDFEEATFFKPDEWKDNEMDVENDF